MRFAIILLLFFSFLAQAARAERMDPVDVLAKDCSKLSLDELQKRFEPKSNAMDGWAKTFGVTKSQLIKSLFFYMAAKGDEVQRASILVAAGADELLYGLKMAERFRRPNLVSFFSKQMDIAGEARPDGYQFATKYRSRLTSKDWENLKGLSKEPQDQALIAEAYGLWLAYFAKGKSPQRLDSREFAKLMAAYQQEFEKETRRPSWGVSLDTWQKFFALLSNDAYLGLEQFVFAFRWLGPATDPISESLPPAEAIISMVFDQRVNKTPYWGPLTMSAAAGLFQKDAKLTHVYWLAAPQKAPGNRLYHRRFMASFLVDGFYGTRITHANQYIYDMAQKKVVDSPESRIDMTHDAPDWDDNQPEFVTQVSSELPSKERQEVMSWSKHPNDRVLMAEAYGLWLKLFPNRNGLERLTMNEFVKVMVKYQTQFEAETGHSSWGVTPKTWQMFFKLLTEPHLPSLDIDGFIFAFRWLGPATDPVSRDMPPAEDIISTIFTEQFKAPVDGGDDISSWQWALEPIYLGRKTVAQVSETFKQGSFQVAHWLAAPQKAPGNRLYHRRFVTTFVDGDARLVHENQYVYDMKAKKVVDANGINVVQSEKALSGLNR